MHIGQQLMTPDQSSRSVFSEWTKRGGDYGTFTVDLITAFAAKITVEVYHKNAEDTGPGSLKAAVVTNLTTVGVKEGVTIGPLQEMVRYKITVTSDNSGSTGAILYRILTPTWFDAALV